MYLAECCARAIMKPINWFSETYQECMIQQPAILYNKYIFFAFLYNAICNHIYNYKFKYTYGDVQQKRI